MKEMGTDQKQSDVDGKKKERKSEQVRVSCCSQRARPDDGTVRRTVSTTKYYYPERTLDERRIQDVNTHPWACL
jgi:hypothetical protein